MCQTRKGWSWHWRGAWEVMGLIDDSWHWTPLPAFVHQRSLTGSLSRGDWNCNSQVDGTPVGEKNRSSPPPKYLPVRMHSATVKTGNYGFTSKIKQYMGQCWRNAWVIHALWLWSALARPSDVVTAQAVFPGAVAVKMDFSTSCNGLLAFWS